MKIFIQTLYPAPYRVGVFNLLNEKVDLFVAFEKSEGDNRNKEWFDRNINFKNVILDEKQSKNKYKKEIKKIKEYDFIIAYEYSTIKSMKLMLKCIINKKPYLINCDGAIIQTSFIKDIIKKFFIKRAKACLANGKSAKEYFLRYGAKEEKIYFHKFSSLYEKDILNEPVDKKQKAKLKKELGLNYEKVYLSIGSFTYRKGFDNLIEAINKVDTKKECFVFIGGGEEAEKYNEKIKEYKINNIKIIDFKKKEELFKYYDACDIFIFPTRGDIWGLVVNEAMARGLPVIATDNCMAALELIENSKNGKIIKTDSIEELTEIIEEYNKLSDLELIKQGNESINTIKDYTIENIAQSHIEILEKIKEEIV